MVKRNNKKYIYKAIVDRVVDGDTFDCIVDLGFNIIAKMRFRLRNINTPEIRGKEREEGLIVKEYVKGLIENKEVLIETFKLGKYGRYIVEIYLDNNEELSTHLLDRGMGKPFMTIEGFDIFHL